VISHTQGSMTHTKLNPTNADVTPRQDGERRAVSCLDGLGRKLPTTRREGQEEAARKNDVTAQILPPHNPSCWPPACGPHVTHRRINGDKAEQKQRRRRIASYGIDLNNYA